VGVLTGSSQRALARAAGLSVTLPLLVPTEAVVTTRRTGWEPPLALALNPEQIRPAP